MKILLLIWGIVSGAFAVLILGAATGAVHEIEAGIGFLITTVSWGLAGVIDAVEQHPKRLLAGQRKQALEDIINRTTESAQEDLHIGV